MFRASIAHLQEDTFVQYDNLYEFNVYTDTLSKFTTHT